MTTDSLTEQKEEVIVNGHDEAEKDTKEAQVLVNGGASTDSPETNGESKTESAGKVTGAQKDEDKKSTEDDKKKDGKAKPVIRYDE